MAATTAEVQAAVDALCASLGHAVLVEDAQHRPLWWSAQGEVDGTRARTILQRQVEPAAAAVVVRLGLAEAQGPVRIPAAPEADMLPRWCVPLRAARDLLGYLWVLDADETVSDAQLPAMLRCAELAAGSLARERFTGAERDRRRTGLLARLAFGADEDAAGEFIRLENLDPAVTVTVQEPRRAAGWELPNGMSVHVAGVGSAPATSGPPVGLGQLHVAVRRALMTARALRAGAVLPRPSWDALGSWHLIATAPDDLDVADIHPGARVLAAQERPDLIRTARALLEHGGDVARTAEQLHIHRTTLYYRLERIEALIGVNLKTGSDRDDLHMALRLAAYRQGAE